MEQLLDIILLVVLGGFALYGFASGFVQTVASLVGFAFSLLVASRLYVELTGWILPDVLADRPAVQVIVFFCLLALITSLVNVLVRIVDNVFHVVAIVPFTKTLNRLLGFVLGTLLGALVIVSVFVAAQQLPAMPEGLQAMIDSSSIAQFLMFLSGLVVLFFPDAVAQVREQVGV